MPKLHPDKRKSVRMAVDANYRRRQAAKKKSVTSPVLPGGENLSLIDRMAYFADDPRFARYFNPGKPNG